jgi:hypothetical protein
VRSELKLQVPPLATPDFLSSLVALAHFVRLYGKPHTWPWTEPGSALSKNISTKGPLNRRSLGFARDDKVEGSAPMESRCCMRAVFHLLGWADGP